MQCCLNSVVCRSVHDSSDSMTALNLPSVLLMQKCQMIPLGWVILLWIWKTKAETTAVWVLLPLLQVQCHSHGGQAERGGGVWGMSSVGQGGVFNGLSQDAPSPLPQGASGWAQSSTLQGCPGSAVWSQAEQIKRQTTFSLLTLPRYQTCWQLVSRQKRRKGKQTGKRRKKALLVSALHKKYQGRSRWIDIWGQKKPSTCFPTHQPAPHQHWHFGRSTNLCHPCQRTKGGGEKKIIWKDISHQFSCFPQADPGAAQSQLWITKSPELRKTGKARVSSCTHLTFPLLQKDQRNFSFFCATTGGKVPAPKPQSVTKITETTNKPIEKYLFVSTQKCVWFIQLMSEQTIIWLLV